MEDNKQAEHEFKVLIFGSFMLYVLIHSLICMNIYIKQRKK
jgi:hypothetical protein